MRMHKRVGVTTLLLIASVATVVLLSPSGSTESSTIAIESGGVASPGMGGMRAYVDPETGELTANIDPNAVITLDPETQNALRYDDEGLEIVRHANGSTSVIVQERYQNASVARVDKNGNVIVCTDKIANVERSLNEQTSAPSTLEVK